MAYTKVQLKDMFQSSFDLQKWTDFIIDFFKAREVYRTPEQIDIDPSEGRGYVLGYLDTSDTYRISFFYLKLNRSIDQRKVGLRQLIDRYIKIDSDAGIGVFDDGKHWRLSFITDLRGEKTSPKRYTFVFGERQNQYLTAIDRFMGLQKKGISFASIKEAFSVEALTKQFYNDLFNWYTWALKEDTGVYFPNNPNTPTDDRENLDTKIIRLITRLMFVWFIKQKGLVPDALFNPAEVDAWLKDFDPQSMESANYYQGILQNLFFATLNRPIKTESIDKDGNVVIKRRKFAKNQNSPDVKSLYRYIELFKISEDKILSIFEFIPFINGGLFECLDKNKTQDGVENAYFEDGFSRNSTIKNGRWTRRAFIPNKLFFDPEDGIISIFNRYNFTVEENSPSEQQVALDPELLGKVFENLLGVFNPETNETARKQSGSFYTPREIVNYMVDISLQAYLGNTDEVKGLFADDFVYDESKRVQLRSGFGIKEDCVVMGHLGKIYKPKNHPYLIRVFNEFQKLVPNSVLFLVGDGVMRQEVESLVDKLELREKVIFAGLRTDVPDMLQVIDCFVFPSIWEGLPLSVFEAMSSGLPCFISDHITKEVMVSPYIHALSIDDTPASWAVYIKAHMPAESRENVCRTNGECITKAGYNIVTEAGQLRDIYLRN